MKVERIYSTAISTRRLTELLEDAGFEVKPPQDLIGQVLMLEANPQKGTLTLGVARVSHTGVALDVETLHGRKPKEENIRPAGQYL